MLPLLRLAPQYSGDNFVVCVEGASEDDEHVLGVAIGEGGVVSSDPRAVAVAEAWARGTVTAWSDFLTGKETARLRIGGDEDLARAWLASLCTAHRTPVPPGASELQQVQ